MSNIQFVEMYHPNIPGTVLEPALVAAQAVDEWYAKGWLLVDPDAPPPVVDTPYYTKETADSRFAVTPANDAAKEGYVPARLADSALRAAFVSRLGGQGGLLVDALASDTVVGDGIADDTLALQALLDFIASWGGTLLIDKHALTAPLRPAAGVRIRGRNDQSGFVLPSGAAFAAVDIDGAGRVIVSDFQVTAAGATAGGGAAVSVRGEAADVTVSNVRTQGIFEGFRIEGGVGTVPGTVRRVLLHRCHTADSDQYGYRLDDIDGLDIAFCSSDGSGLDGIKLRKRVKNWTITGGYFTGATGGDGLDAYAGGESGTILGGTYSGNGINGITIKTDDLNRDDPANFGMPRSITLSGVRCDNNTGNGLWVGRNGTTDDATEPLVARVSVLGGSFNGNGGHGTWVRARSTVLSGIQAARNQGNGIRVDAAALDTVIVAPQVGGNGARDTVTDGIHVAGPRTQVLGGASIGTDPDGATSDTDLGAGIKTQRFGLRLEATATGCVIVGVTAVHNRTGAVSDASGSAMILAGTTDDGAAALLTLPNNRRLYGRKADGTLLSLAYVTTGGGFNLGDGATGMSLLGTQVTCYPKLVAAGELEMDGALNHDGTTVGFYGATPVARPTALTAADASAVDATYGAEEAAVIGNLRTRLNELETKLRSVGLLT